MADDPKSNFRAWAVEQAVRLHGDHGATTEKLLEEAQKLLDFVNGAPSGKNAKP